MRPRQRHKASDLALDHAPPVLEFAKAALELAPAPGLSLIGEALSAIVERVKDARTNGKTEAAFFAKVRELDDAIASMVNKAKTAAGGSGIAELEERLDQLSIKLVETRASADRLEGGRGFRGSLKSIFYAKRNEATLEDMNTQVAGALEMFNLHGQVSTEIAVHNVGHAVEGVSRNVTAVGHAVNGVGYAVAAVGYAIDGVGHAVHTVGDTVNSIGDAMSTVGYAVSNVQRAVMSAEETRTVYAIPHASAGYHCVDELKSGFLQGTREELFEELAQWCGQGAPAELTKPLYFLDGSAGLGKSSIAHQLCTRVAERWRLNLGSSFFFSRGRGDLESARLFFTTLAHQLALSQPSLRPFIVRAGDDYLRDGERQQVRKTFYELLLKPLLDSLGSNGSQPTTFIVIDGLDECKDRGLVPELLRCLLELVQKVPWLRVFVTSRPEPHVLPYLLSSSASSVTYHRSLNDTIIDWKDDVGLCLRQTIPKLQSYGTFLREHPDALESLITRAGGLFVYARIALKFLETFDDHPEEQFALLLASSGAGLSPLDDLYLQILRSGFPPKDLRASLPRQGRLRKLLMFITLRQADLPPASIALLLELSLDDVTWMVDRLRSVLLVDSQGDVVPLHATFGEFLIDKDRCIDALYHIDRAKGHASLASRCLAALSFDTATEFMRYKQQGTNTAFIDYIMYTGCWNTHIAHAERSDALEAQLYDAIRLHLPIIVRLHGPVIEDEADRIAQFLQHSDRAGALCGEYMKFGDFFQQWWEATHGYHDGVSPGAPKLYDRSGLSASQDDRERYQEVLDELMAKVKHSGTGQLWYNLRIACFSWTVTDP